MFRHLAHHEHEIKKNGKCLIDTDIDRNKTLMDYMMSN